MKVCPYCAHNNMEGVLFCEDCGEVLSNTRSNPIGTKQIGTITEELVGKSTWGTARFGREAQIIIHVRDVVDPILLEPADETTLGRADAATGTRPGVDLTPFGAQEKGVSRIHAAIRRGDETLTLIDLGSVNGTHLNGQRLVPNQPRVLRDGDEIRLGKMVCHIYFK
jgi:pSer/pThr/pTyr-binding forkhead associated (FHA) protein